MQTTFTYDSNLWNTTSLHNIAGGVTGFDSAETKLPTYNYLPFTKLCLVFRPVSGTQEGYVLIDRNSSQTLHSLISDNQYRSTSVGRRSWLSSLSGAALQRNCNREGFNTKDDRANHVHARIGIIGNNENSCSTSDTVFGVGFRGGGCGVNVERMSAGGLSNPLCNRSNGNPFCQAFTYILAQ